MFRVELTACVAGNPYKAWKGSTGPDDTVHVPDDVWEDQSHAFATVEEAVSFVRGLPEPTTTHVQIVDDAGLVLFHQDGGDDLDTVTADTESVWMTAVQDTGPVEAKIPDAPPLMPSQGGAQ